MSKNLSVRSVYLELMMLFERLNRLFLEIVRLELDRIAVKDLNNTQAIILYQIGNNEITVGEITARGYYLGSNVSYNLKKMVENGYVIQRQSKNDKRSIYVSLSAKGKQVYKKVESIICQQTENLAHNHFPDKELARLLEQIRRLENFLSTILMQNVRIF